MLYQKGWENIFLLKNGRKIQDIYILTYFYSMVKIIANLYQNVFYDVMVLNIKFYFVHTCKI